MPIIKCKGCNHFFNPYNSWDSQYCSEECFLVYSANSANLENEKKHRNICLGMLCRGHKEFITNNKFNRICIRCKLHMKRYNNDSQLV